MRVKEILTDYKLCVVDLEVQLNGETTKRELIL